MKLTLELTTNLPNLQSLLESDLSPYQSLYLGHPYCADYRGNLLDQPDDLREAVDRLRQQGKRVYLCTPAAPKTREFDRVRRVLEMGAALGVDAVETHNLGVVRILNRECPGLPIHTGVFANVYTDAGAVRLREYGVRRVTPNHELSLEEIDRLAAASGLEVEILAHGKMPLGITDACYLLQHRRASGLDCPDLCREELWLRRRDWVLKPIGQVMLSGQDVCLLEHLPELLRKGYAAFRVEALTESPAYRSRAGQIYADALSRAAERPAATKLADWLGRLPDWLAELRAHSAHGLCNGYYFARSGRDYVSRAEAQVGMQGPPGVAGPSDLLDEG